MSWSSRIDLSDSNKNGNRKALAQAGLDLFLSGFEFDGLNTRHREPRHPATAPNLCTIPEGKQLAHYDSIESQLIFVISSDIKLDGSPSRLLKNRIIACAKLYESIIESYRQENCDSRCYIVPAGGDPLNIGIMENEVIRNELVKNYNISQHQILMDCVEENSIDNAVRLSSILMRLGITLVHVVTSEFHLPRLKLYIDGVLGAISGKEFSIIYHGVPDGLSSSERAEVDAKEQTKLLRTENQLNEAISRIKNTWNTC